MGEVHRAFDTPHETDAAGSIAGSARFGHERALYRALMTVPPPSGPGPHGGWNQPLAGGAWPPPAGVGGYPEPGYRQGPGGYPGNGYGQAPTSYPPPVGYPGPGYPPPPQKPGTNGFAIAALIFGIIGGVLLGSSSGSSH